MTEAPARTTPERRALLLALGGGAVALLIAIVLFAQFSINGNFWRDEAIYAYGGQQLADGVPVYSGIFDPKPPLPTFLTALGTLSARAVGKNDLTAMRAEFFLFAILTVVAVYVLGLWLWRSILAALVGAVVFASFQGFAQDALAGPGAKTPGILLMVVSLALLVRRRWFLAGIAGSLAFLDWQPLGICAAAAVVAALVVTEPEDESRWKRGARALGGVAIPLVATVLFLLIDGGLSRFIEASFTFPATGLRRGNVTLGGNIDTIVRVVNDHYGHTRVLFWGGLILLVAAAFVAAKRFAALVVVGTLLAFAAASVYDFQGYPDLFPLLPYAGLGIGGVVAVIAPRVRAEWPRRIAAGLALVAVGLLAGLSVHWFSGARDAGPSLHIERAQAAKIQRLLQPGEKLYALGDPTLLVLTHRRNPTRYIYLGSGVDHWAVEHEFGSLAGWQAEIRAADPPIVVMNLWRSDLALQMRTWLKQTYGPGKFLGNWRLFVKPSVRARAARMGIKL
jgi:hypothetical protein